MSLESGFGEMPSCLWEFRVELCIHTLLSCSKAKRILEKEGKIIETIWFTLTDAYRAPAMGPGGYKYERDKNLTSNNL